MNQTKRTLELIGAIVSIIAGAILAFSGLSCVAAPELLKQMLLDQGMTLQDYNAVKEILNLVFWIMIILGALIVLFGALLCKQPKVDYNGQIKERKGITTALIIFLVVFGIEEITSSPLLGILFLAPAILLTVSSTMKHNYVGTSTSNGYSFNPNANVTPTQTGGMFNNQQPTVKEEENKSAEEK